MNIDLFPQGEMGRGASSAEADSRQPLFIPHKAGLTLLSACVGKISQCCAYPTVAIDSLSYDMIVVNVILTQPS